jgi:hypothetical protein
MESVYISKLSAQLLGLPGAVLVFNNTANGGGGAYIQTCDQVRGRCAYGNPLAVSLGGAARLSSLTL